MCVCVCVCVCGGGGGGGAGAAAPLSKVIKIKIKNLIVLNIDQLFSVVANMHTCITIFNAIKQTMVAVVENHILG